jgi:hypothetical protein
MSGQVPLERIKKPLMNCFDETFSSVHGMYLDKGTTLFETLEGVSSYEASQSVGPGTATVAAQVEHLRFYLDVLNDYIHTSQDKKIDWREIWETVREVTPEQWERIKQDLRDSYEKVKTTLNSFQDWNGENEVGGALAIVVHTAYHLGGIRQALAGIRANSTKTAGHAQ